MTLYQNTTTKMRSIIGILLILAFSCRGFSNRSLINYSLSLTALVDSLGISTSDIYIFIDKSDYILSIMVDSLIVKQYPVVLGGNPVDDKRMQGDQCTPEGQFSVRAKYPHRSRDKFIWIDYPNEDSWKKFNKDNSEGKIPADASIGGAIVIHGVPLKADEIINLGINWTLGCISLKNDDINDLYPFIEKGSLVIIQT